MSNRKKLTDIQAIFQEPEQHQPTTATTNSSQETEDSLSAQLQKPKQRSSKIRFTLDLEKPLDERLNRASSKLNRSKADLTRIALERLLDDLEQEWS